MINPMGIRLSSRVLKGASFDWKFLCIVMYDHCQTFSFPFLRTKQRKTESYVAGSILNKLGHFVQLG